jgi:hypothetical protein
MAVECPVSSWQPARAMIGQSREPGAFRRGGALSRDRRGRPAGGSAHRLVLVLGQPCIDLSRRLWTAEGSRPGASTVIHYSTAAPVHSCVVVDQLVYLNHPQAYTQGASLAGPGAGVIGARSHAGPGDLSACGAIIAPGSDRNTGLVVMRVRSACDNVRRPGHQERVTAVTHDRRSTSWRPDTDRVDGVNGHAASWPGSRSPTCGDAASHPGSTAAARLLPDD